MGRAYRVAYGEDIQELGTSNREDMLVDTTQVDARVLEHGSDASTKVHECPKKRIIVACDGTWMDSDGVQQVPSNITRIVRAVSLP